MRVAAPVGAPFGGTRLTRLRLRIGPETKVPQSSKTVTSHHAHRATVQIDFFHAFISRGAKESY